MAPPAGVRVEGRLQFSREKVVERFHDIFDHPHKLVVRRGWGRALCHKVANGLCGVAQTEQERCRGVSDEAFWGERLSSGKLRHDISEREDEAAQVLLR